MPPPHRWIAPLAGQLRQELHGARIEGVLGGRGWLSLRVDGRFLWFVALSGLRAAWLDEHGVPARYAEALGRHQRSPFAPLLQGQVLRELSRMQDEAGEPVGLRLELEEQRALCVRFWPRPGALWVEDAQGSIASVSPPDAHECTAGLGPIPAQADAAAETPSWDAGEAAAHSELCRRALEDHLENAILRRLRDATRGARRKAERLAEALAREGEEAQRQSGLRGQADLLAAHLHRVPRGTARFDLEDFEGRPVQLELDPASSPAENLEKLYRQAGRAERKLAQLERRQEETTRHIEATRRAEEAVQELHGLEAALELAQELGVELRPRAPGEHRGQSKPRAPRLPYRVFVLTTQREVWVGRGARDNDTLTFRHAAPLDLWFHAGGVEGSHVVLRHLGRDPSAAEQEAAAQLAALFSKAKGATTVPVWMTQRRYVRKPRKAPPGTVQPERVSTIFVEPVEPAGAWRRQES